MKRQLFLTSVPSFYKINLFNELSKIHVVYVFYTFRSKIQRKSNFFLSATENYKIIYNKSVFNLILSVFKVDEIFFGGWDDLYYYLLVLFSKKEKNVLILESSILEYNNTTFFNKLKNTIKYFYLKKFSKVIVSGIPHKFLLEKLNFKGEIIISQGVGVLDFNYPQVKKKYITQFDNKFLFIGRDSPEKGLENLLHIFKKHNNWKLNILGDFSNQNLYPECANVSFHGYVNRNNITKHFDNNSVLIVPSNLEPWGLVVEEALYHGMPVIVSSKVGCAQDFVINKETGLVYESDNSFSLEEKIIQMSDVNLYNKFINNINNINFDKHKSHYVKSFL